VGSLARVVLEWLAFAFWELAAVSVSGLIASSGGAFDHGGRREGR
jgi:hypothetical protein